MAEQAQQLDKEKLVRDNITDLRKLLEELNEKETSLVNMNVAKKAYYKFIDEMIHVQENIFPLNIFAAIMYDFDKIPFFKDFDLQMIDYKLRLSIAIKCRAVLFNERLDSVLVMKGFQSKKWTLIGGCTEGKEEIKDCVKRETDEELGLEIDFRFDPIQNMLTHYYPQVILENTLFSPKFNGEVAYIA